MAGLRTESLSLQLNGHNQIKQSHNYSLITLISIEEFILEEVFDVVLQGGGYLRLNVEIQIQFSKLFTARLELLTLATSG